MACGVCWGSDCAVWDREKPELCSCEGDDGIDENGRIVTTANFMRRLRRDNWERSIKWRGDEDNRVLRSTEVLHEDLQDQSVPMVAVGSDVISLYPNLDINKVVEAVEVAILESTIQWEEVDYLEASRYVALNWTKEQCAASPLGRILPTRRYTGGSRPGLRGSGPMGGQRGTKSSGCSRG